MAGLKSLKEEDLLFGRVIKYERGWKCERCGWQAAPGAQKLQASHFVGRVWKTLRFDKDNVDVLCASCHGYLELRKGTEYRNWKEKHSGKEVVDRLTFLSRAENTNPPSKEQVKEWKSQWRKEIKAHEIEWGKQREQRRDN